MTRVLQEVQPQECVALDWLGNGLHILHNFTTDAAVLRQVLAGYESKSSRVLPNAVQLCIVVRDAGSSNMGSIYVPLA